ncbi:MAG: LbtU family siderophore porin [Gammaproteobacteria bacterium]|nr:LbtU family siderophore porin [Gammaproteobacteria bacterium]
MKLFHSTTTISLLSLSLLSGNALAKDIEVSALIEVEAVNGENYASEKTTDITVATVEIGLDAAINEQLSGHVLFLYEEDATDPPVIDEASFSMQLNPQLSLTAGKVYLPFGQFETGLVSDPLTLQLAEAGESVFQLDFNNEAMSASIYMFNGDAVKFSDTDDNTLSYGFNIGFSPYKQLDINLGYISNLADTDALQALGTTAGATDDHVAGMSLSASMTSGNIKVIIEHIAAMDDFIAGDFDITADMSPSASNIELNLSLEGDMTLALAYQQTSDSLFMELPESAILAAVSMPLVGGVNMGVEYASMSDYGTGDGGTGDDAKQLTLQLSTEF